MPNSDFLDAILNNLEEGLLILNPQWEVLLFNKELERIHQELGWPPPETGVPFTPAVG